MHGVRKSAFTAGPSRRALRLCLDDTTLNLSESTDALLAHAQQPLVETMKLRDYPRRSSRMGWGVTWGGIGWWGHPSLVWKTRFNVLRLHMRPEHIGALKQKIAVYEYSGRRDFDAFVTECPC